MNSLSTAILDILMSDVAATRQSGLHRTADGSDAPAGEHILSGSMASASADAGQAAIARGRPASQSRASVTSAWDSWCPAGSVVCVTSAPALESWLHSPAELAAGTIGS